MQKNTFLNLKKTQKAFKSSYYIITKHIWVNLKTKKNEGKISESNPKDTYNTITYVTKP